MVFNFINMITKEKIVGFMGVVFFVFILYVSNRNASKKENSMQQNMYLTVGKIYKFYSNRSFNHYYYIYYFNNKKYKGISDLNNFDKEESIGRYYRVELSSVEPEYCEIFLDQEVTDSTEIVNAGFKYEPPQAE